MAKKEKLEKLKKQHNNWIESLGVSLDMITGNVQTGFDGYDMPDYTCRPSLPTSDKIDGECIKRKYATQIPAGKTISVAYNKGPYMIVDAKDFKTMGKKI